MASLSHVVLGILILQIYVYAAPSDVSKLEDIAKVELSDPKLDSQPKEVNSDSDSTETARQKRWYNPYGFGFPTANPFFYQNVDQRNEGPNTGFYGGEDPLAQIHRRVQEIANIVRQPIPPPPAHIPIFYPILFIPSGDCNCNQNPTTPEPDTNFTPDTNDTVPSVTNRWPVMEDTRQNWGYVINETDTEEGVDFNRPISFDPIRLNTPMRPPPPVEHGSVQSDSTNKQDQPNFEAPSTQSSSVIPQTTRRPPSRPQNSPPIQNRPSSGLAPPSTCDGAVLTCCHQAITLYDCFAIQGCPDFTAYGNPCDPKLILRVVERFQTYYSQRSG